MQRIRPSAALAALLVASALPGCVSKSANRPLSQQEQDLMRQPAGTVPMPAQAAEAMRRGGAAAEKAKAASTPRTGQ